MKFERLYCKQCRKETIHDVKQEWSGGEKIIYWLLIKPCTLGLQDNDTTYECQVCGGNR